MSMAGLSFIFVNDLAKIVEHFVSFEAKEKFYHTASMEKHSLLHVAQKIKTISGKDIEILIKQPGMAKEYTCSTSRLMSELKNFEFTELDESLKEMYNWYSTNKSLIDEKKFI